MSRPSSAAIARGLGCALLALGAGCFPGDAEDDSRTGASSPELATARDLEHAFIQVADGVSSSVVSLWVEVPVPDVPPYAPLPPFGLRVLPEDAPEVVYGTGSGVVIRPDGHVLTTYHVVRDARRIVVELSDGRAFLGRVVGHDLATDLAIVRIPAKGLTPAAFANSSDARPGQWVLAIGAPFALEYSVTAGVISAVGRDDLGVNDVEDYLQTDASINPGNSGGPLVDLEGRVVGINTIIVGPATGIGFAVPSNLARAVASRLMVAGETASAQP